MMQLRRYLKDSIFSWVGIATLVEICHNQGNGILQATGEDRNFCCFTGLLQSSKEIGRPLNAAMAGQERNVKVEVSAS